MSCCSSVDPALMAAAESLAQDAARSASSSSSYCDPRLLTDAQRALLRTAPHLVFLAGLVVVVVVADADKKNSVKEQQKVFARLQSIYRNETENLAQEAGQGGDERHDSGAATYHLSPTLLPIAAWQAKIVQQVEQRRNELEIQAREASNTLLRSLEQQQHNSNESSKRKRHHPNPN